MAQFIELHVATGVFPSQWINMDLVQEIVPPQHTTYGARLIFVGIDSADNDYMHTDVLQTPEQIFNLMVKST